MRDCNHAETTVAWLYGEAPEEHALHVASCPLCTEVLATHERVLGATAPLKLEAPAARGASWRRAGWVLALAAAGLAWMMWGPSSEVEALSPAIVQLDDATPVYGVADIDQEIDALSLALDDLSEDFSTL